MKKINILKSFLMLTVLLGISACNNDKAVNTQGTEKNVGEQAKEGNSKVDVSLTKEEEAKYSKDPNAVLNLLLSKAVLDKSSKTTYTPEQKEQLENIKKNAEVQYYLSSTILSSITVTDAEVTDFYNKNKQRLGNKPLKDVAPQIKELLKANKYSQIYTAKLQEILNNINKEYKINEVMKKYVPEDVMKNYQNAAQQAQVAAQQVQAAQQQGQSVAKPQTKVK